jgi:hypothetical protein
LPKKGVALLNYLQNCKRIGTGLSKSRAVVGLCGELMVILGGGRRLSVIRDLTSKPIQRNPQRALRAVWRQVLHKKTGLAIPWTFPGQLMTDEAGKG